MKRMQRFDDLWEGFRSEDLKRMIVIWGGSAKLRKDECIGYLRVALTDPHQIDSALARMRHQERAALGLVKLLGGSADLFALGTAARATGTVPVQANYDRYSDEAHVEKSLVDRGIVAQTGGYRYISDSYIDRVDVFADERVLDRIVALEHLPLPLDSVEIPAVSTFRRAQSIVLDIISIVRILGEIGGVGLTKAGELRTNDVRKLARKLGWGDQTEVDGLAFPEPTRAHILAMAKGGLLSQHNQALVGAATLEQIGAWPATQVLRKLAFSVPLLKDWAEHQPSSWQYWFQNNAPKGRLAVLTALRCLPDRLGWFRFEDFERALFERIGESFSMDGTPSRPYFFSKSAAEQRAELQNWRHKIRANWEKYDVPWLQAVFQTWLYAFGLVEVRLVNGVVDRFRLTDAGRAVLWDESTEEAVHIPAEHTPAWIVQPNFDVVVYLGSASTAQVAFLEQIAERVQIAQHTAQYRLTCDSVYEGMQRGIGVDRLLELLATGSQVELPSNVAFEIRTWAALRGRIVLRRRADLLEFPDASARQKATAGGTAGLAVGERFLLLPGSGAASSNTDHVASSIDYLDPPANGSLLLSEDGLVTIVPEHSNLLTVGYLQLWASHERDEAWRLSRASVQQAIKSGRTLAELMGFLQARLKRAIPGILVVALRAWAGESAKAGMAEAVVLRCAQTEVLSALLAAQALKPHLLGQIGPDALLVKPESVAKVRAVLEWAGIKL